MITSNKLSADYVGASSTNTFKTELTYPLVGWKRRSEKVVFLESQRFPCVEFICWLTILLNYGGGCVLL